LLVFAREGRAAGLMVDEIVDIVQGSLTTELKPTAEGSLGSLIIDEHATELIDVDYYWRQATGDSAPAIMPAHGHAPSTQRLLLVDQSPFSQIMLKPLLAQAGYNVTVVADADAALAFHDAGQAFDLIMADTATHGPDAKRFAAAFAKARDWHATPLLGLGLYRPGESDFDRSTVLDAVSETLGEGSEPALRGAA
jgi:two-component system chemotaxis sensor kinase CheA